MVVWHLSIDIQYTIGKVCLDFPENIIIDTINWIYIIYFKALYTYDLIFMEIQHMGHFLCAHYFRIHLIWGVLSMQKEKNKMSMIGPWSSHIYKSRADNDLMKETKEEELIEGGRELLGFTGRTYIQGHLTRRGRCITLKAFKIKGKEDLQRFIGCGNW